MLKIIWILGGYNIVAKLYWVFYSWKYIFLRSRKKLFISMRWNVCHTANIDQSRFGIRVHSGFELPRKFPD